jgi:DNA-binding NtrC family response regulator
MVGNPCGGTTESEGAAVLVGSRSEEDHTSLRAIFGPSDWKLHEAKSFTQALAALSENHIPVVICDQELPVGGWKALFEAIQLLPRPPNLIVTSRQADNRLWAEVLNLGGHDVLAIPFDAGEVRRAAQQAWRGWKRQWGTALAELLAGAGQDVG